MSKEIKGISVSVKKKTVNFAQLKEAGIEFVILRAGYGRLQSQKDEAFEKYYTAAKEAGLKVGAYWQSYADTVVGAKLEAVACLSAIKGKTFDLPVYCTADNTDVAMTFCDTVTAGGFKAGMCTDVNIKQYSVWASKKVKGADIWQSDESIDGVNGDVLYSLLTTTAKTKKKKTAQADTDDTSTDTSADTSTATAEKESNK